jgi:hypothetical protein
VHPWWANDTVLRRPAGLRATAWVHGGRALLVLANLGPAPIAGEVALDRFALGVFGARRVRDLEAPAAPPIVLDGGAFSIDVPPRELRIMLLE